MACSSTLQSMSPSDTFRLNLNKRKISSEKYMPPQVIESKKQTSLSENDTLLHNTTHPKLNMSVYLSIFLSIYVWKYIINLQMHMKICLPCIFECCMHILIYTYGVRALEMHIYMCGICKYISYVHCTCIHYIYICTHIHLYLYTYIYTYIIT